ncbi:FHA domain-containing protein [Thermomonospora echinospora]|uniref:FHA domain-containing protein n=1 Tax=Thermomonospora echinospora TaxID=1992 RepID=A0A1H6CRY7_9ACTN|nr:FHA domain-containing protein [Thermomonospora echinospora]SEG75761.1 FHA domain-containing protein [Thermomonospora echinospora]
MSEFTLTLIKLAFLAVLWLFVIAAVGVIRADLFGSSRAAARAAARSRAPRPARRPRPQRAQQAPQPRGPRQLVVTQGDRAGMTIDLATGGTITIGRANDATIVVSDDYASSRHARLFAQDGQWIVEDLGSTNGTYLGRNKVNQPTPVPPGVPIRIGKTVIELRP